MKVVIALTVVLTLATVVKCNGYYNRPYGIYGSQVLPVVGVLPQTIIGQRPYGYGGYDYGYGGYNRFPGYHHQGYHNHHHGYHHGHHHHRHG